MAASFADLLAAMRQSNHKGNQKGKGTPDAQQQITAFMTSASDKPQPNDDDEVERLTDNRAHSTEEKDRQRAKLELIVKHWGLQTPNARSIGRMSFNRMWQEAKWKAAEQLAITSKDVSSIRVPSSDPPKGCCRAGTKIEQLVSMLLSDEIFPEILAITDDETMQAASSKEETSTVEHAKTKYTERAKEIYFDFLQRLGTGSRPKLLEWLQTMLPACSHPP